MIIEKNNIEQAIQKLKNGELIAFPTETVYGLGASANNEQAILKVFAIKKRPAQHPLIVHLARYTEIINWAVDIPKAAYVLGKYFWPGPLTLILKKHSNVSSLITGGQPTIALRVPQHPLTLELLDKLKTGLVGPSANLYQHVSPTMAGHVRADFGDQIDILDGGPCSIGIESTIVSLIDTQPIILRQGCISADDISKVLKQNVKYLHNSGNDDQTINVRVPGSHKIHYAPTKPLYLIESHVFDDTVVKWQEQGKRCAVLSFHKSPDYLLKSVIWYLAPTNPQDYARCLYANLRILDNHACDVILVEKLSDNYSDIVWHAICDRLNRAAMTS